MASAPTSGCRVRDMAASCKQLTKRGLAIRSSCVFVYVIWVLIGGWIFYKRDIASHTQYVVSRDLPPGYLLREGDLRATPERCPNPSERPPTIADIANKYLVHAYKSGTPIQRSDIGASPMVTPAGQKTKYLFPLQMQSNLAETLNAGSRVDVCWKVCVLEDVPVLAILGPIGQKTEFYAILEVSTGDDAKIKDDIGNYRLIPRND